MPRMQMVLFETGPCGNSYGAMTLVLLACPTACIRMYSGRAGPVLLCKSAPPGQASGVPPPYLVKFQSVTALRKVV